MNLVMLFHCIVVISSLQGFLSYFYVNVSRTDLAWHEGIFRAKDIFACSDIISACNNTLTQPLRHGQDAISEEQMV